MKKLIIPIIACGLWISSCGTEAQERMPSASPQVVIPQDSVYITSLERYRKIRLYLPEGYENSEERYPVMYMHDGQNLFDDVTSYVGEWGVDEALDSLSALGLKLIVVGIDNGQEKRMTEYGPWDNNDFGDAEGPEYVQFIVEELKPSIDKTYRTLPEKENTGIMGSSMGGLISHYAMVRYPEVFGKIGIYSPSYWYAEDIWDFTGQISPDNGQKIDLLVGGREGRGVVENVEKMKSLLMEKSVPASHLRVIVDKQGEHNEKFWRKYFAESIVFLFGE